MTAWPTGGGPEGGLVIAASGRQNVGMFIGKYVVQLVARRRGQAA